MFDCLSGREQTRIKRTAIFIIFDDFLALFENAPDGFTRFGLCSFPKDFEDLL
jgi:hypothetical protein